VNKNIKTLKQAEEIFFNINLRPKVFKHQKNACGRPFAPSREKLRLASRLGNQATSFELNGHPFNYVDKRG